MQRKGRRDILPFPEFGRDASTTQFLLPVDSVVDRSKFFGGGLGGGNGVLVTIWDLMNDAVEKVFYPVECQVPLIPLKKPSDGRAAYLDLWIIFPR